MVVTGHHVERRSRPAVPERLRGCVRAFFLPRFDRRFFIRLGLVIVTSYVVFGHLLVPAVSRGSSMEPNYHDGGLNFCWTFRYALRPPKPGDVVMVSVAGKRVMLLKRVVAVAGETVEFRKGQLYVDGRRRAEPWLVYPCDWTLGPRQVEAGYVYVVGDNRSMSHKVHVFGEVPLDRIVGGPLW